MPRQTKKRKTLVSKSKTASNAIIAESYKNLLYGALAVVLIFALFILALKTFSPKLNTGEISQEAAKTTEITLPSATSKVIESSTPSLMASTPASSPIPSYIIQKRPVGRMVYTVKAGDSLWGIAEKYYKSGYNWTDIAKANNLTNPGMIFSGDKLMIPDVQPKLATVTISPTPTAAQLPVGTAQPATVPNKITGTTYTVEHGDDLWNIAVRAYGNGYKWTDIAKVNNLSNPGLIFSGNMLAIPR